MSKENGIWARISNRAGADRGSDYAHQNLVHLAMERALWLNGKNGSLGANESSSPLPQLLHIRVRISHKKGQGSPCKPTGKISDGEHEGQSPSFGTTEQRAGQPVAV